MTLQEMVTEILTGEYAQDVLNYGKDSNGDFQPFEVDINGKQYVIDEQLATKLDTLIAKDFATETTLDTRLSSLENKMDTLLNSQDATDNTLKVTQNGSIETVFERQVINSETTFFVDVPLNAQKAIIMVKAYAATGTFDTGEGYGPRILLQNKLEHGNHGVLIGEFNLVDKSFYDFIAYIGDGYNRIDNTNSNWYTHKIASIGLLNKIKIDLRAIGTFGVDEGIDYEVIIKWMY